jgi:hypothetical protein
MKYLHDMTHMNGTKTCQTKKLIASGSLLAVVACLAVAAVWAQTPQGPDLTATNLALIKRLDGNVEQRLIDAPAGAGFKPWPSQPPAVKQWAAPTRRLA